MYIEYLSIPCYFNSIAGEDFLTTGEHRLFFSNYSRSGKELCFNITIINDITVEPEETLIVTVSTSTSGVRLPNSQFVITITDNDMTSEYVVFLHKK